MSRTNVFPTYIPEIDYQILEEMEDATLLNSCISNTYLADMCEDEVFWRKRALSHYAMLMKFKESDTTWRAFYTRLVNDAMYLIETPDNRVFAYTNAKYASLILWAVVAKNAGISRRAILSTSFAGQPDELKYIIRLAYKGEVTQRDYRTIFDHRDPNNDIANYPRLPGLKLKGLDLFYYNAKRYLEENVFDENTPNNIVSGVFDYNDKVLASFMTYVPDNVDYPHYYRTYYTILNVDEDFDTAYLSFEKFKYGYMNININLLQTTLLVDESLFGRSPKFTKHVYAADYNFLILDNRNSVVERLVEDYYKVN